MNNSNQTIEQSKLSIIPREYYRQIYMDSLRECDRIFVIRPFRHKKSNILWKCIEQFKERNKVRIEQADRPSKFDTTIMQTILDELEKAEIVIADISKGNPNVLYELGIAHTRCKSVIIICDQSEKLPFDLQHLRVIFYHITNTAGQEKLVEELSTSYQRIKSQRPPSILDSFTKRCEYIVRDLRQLSNLPDTDLSNEIVYISGFLSPFAIAPQKNIFAINQSNTKLVHEERDLLLELARRGCQINCIISPPFESFSESYKARDTKRRLEYLINFLESNDPALANIAWAISNYNQKNFYVIGHVSTLEGFKREDKVGYDLTFRQVGPAVLASLSLYNSFFQKIARKTLQKSNLPTNSYTNISLNKATTIQLKNILSQFDLDK